jgi:cystathionine beta-lyase/cystathionine gamma-synthase
MSRPVRPPLVLSSTFVFDDADAMDRAVSALDAPLYTRWDNPTIAGVEARLAALEGADRGLLLSSGMAAVHLAWLAATEGGGPLIVQEAVYGGTEELLRALPWPGVRRLPIEGMIEAAAALPAGAVLHLELPTNPQGRLVDLAALCAAAPHVTVVVDATFASPVLLQPARLGAALVVHSATKYLGGHHDLIAGLIAGEAGLVARAWRWRKVLGPCLDPAAAERLDRGLDTLELRVLRQSQTAATLAGRLADRLGAAAVHSPSLPSHPDHTLARRMMREGLCGGVLSFSLADGAAAARLMNALRVIQIGPSLGGTHSLITRPAGVTHANVPAATRAATGIGPGLLRLAVGVEPADRLWADLGAALDAALSGALEHR